MLDRVFRYLSHATDGWKFSVLMAGPDPTKGGTVIYEYVEPLCNLNCLRELIPLKLPHRRTRKWRSV